MTITTRERERDQTGELPAVVTESASSRFRAWVRHAPAERAPLVLIPAIWTATDIMHAAGVRGLFAGGVAALATAVAGWMGERRSRGAEHPHLAGVEVAAVTAATGAWVTAGADLGPLAGPDHALSLVYLAAAGGGYWWLRRHTAVRAARARRDDAAAWVARKTEWHRTAAALGLNDSHLLKYKKTLLGDARLIDVTGTRRRASSLATKDLAEHIAEFEALPRGRVEVTPDKLAGRIWITVRRIDPWVKPVMHPFASGTLDAASPYAKFTPYPATIRQPQTVGIDPETGDPLQLVLWDKHGAKVVQITAKKDGGKTTMLDSLTERITACPDAVLLQINLSKALEDGWWAPLSAASALDRELAKARRILQFVADVVRERPRGGRNTRVHQPTPAEPLYVLKIDEVDAVTADEACNRLLKKIDSKCRSEGVALVKAGQRATAQWSGGGDAQANTDIAVWGKVARGRERGHVAGAEADLPDMGEYGEGNAGVFGVAELPYTGAHGKGRTFYWGEEAPGLLALVADRAGARRSHVLEPGLARLTGAWQEITAPGGTDDGDEDLDSAGPAPSDQVIQGTEQITAKIRQANALLDEDPPIPDIPPEMEAHAAQMFAERQRQFREQYTSVDIPPDELETIMAMLAAPGGTSAGAVASATGKSRATAHRHLSRLLDAGHAEKLEAAAGCKAGFRARTGTHAGGHLHLVEPAQDEAVGDAQ